ncbi:MULTISPECIES: hypothetical protein [Ruminococcus]|uniref:4-hydroxythreonine-4-phosphate dehydrogenase n=1 Tax=Ruminococcus flavefaciens TaxID=1265 RepID=A0A1M7HNY9_RUMFL|nr:MULTISPECIES: hypothetical protein [Ruminococcus]MCR4796034.1 hypothetical protein [Ruminococcus sp.]SHM30226.1 hypothetical protein SAMN04487860_1039 [Ruminococcus flavefaciens]
MKNKPILIVMLTYNDRTVKNAYEIFDSCKNTKAQYWGFKEEPLPHDEMKSLYKYMKECGKTTVLEVVAYTEEKCIEGAMLAVECGCDILMGTVYSDKINEICKKNNIKYMPFVGSVTDRPSVLEGSIDDMVAEAKSYIAKGVYGIDLLGYRYTGDSYELNRRIVNEVGSPVCIAGSVDSFKRLDEISSISPCAFTIGSALFDNKFNGSFAEQIDKVCEYIENSGE